jgi:hypothetical protein
MCKSGISPPILWVNGRNYVKSTLTAYGIPEFWDTVDTSPLSPVAGSG